MEKDSVDGKLDNSFNIIFKYCTLYMCNFFLMFVISNITLLSKFLK